MKCALCPGVNKCLEPSGPSCSDYTSNGLLFCGEAPGKDENRKGIPFVGKTGQELDLVYLPAGGLRRSNARITNAIRCYPNTSGGKLDPKNKAHLALLQSCTEAHLYPEIRETRPKLIIPMGSFACRAIDPEINLELHHGFPVETKWGPAFPMYHPAQGIHEPKKMMMIKNDWIRLKHYLDGTLVVPVDSHPNPDYKEATEYDIRWLDPTSDMGTDTESSRSLGPFCLTYSQSLGHGRLIRASRTDLLHAYQAKISKWEAHIYFHNWLYDWRVVEDMGLEFPIKRMRDTMERAYLLGNLPQGLKALAYRELGMEMTDYEDVVLPHSKPHVFDYYRMAYTLEWPKPEPIEYRDNNGDRKIKKPQSIKTKLSRFFTDYAKNPDKDIFNMWTENWVDSQEMIEEKLGKWPGSDIAHVPWEIALDYACRDADADLRLNTVLDHMMKQVRKVPQERWRE